VEDAEVLFKQGTTAFTLPTDFLLDFEFTSHVLRDGTVAITQLEIADGGTVGILTVQYTNRAATQVLDFTVPIPVNPSTPYRFLVTTADYIIAAIFGDGVNAVLAHADGIYTAVTPVPLEPALLIYQGKHRVNSIIGDTPESVPVYGDVYFQEGHSVLIKINKLSNSISIIPAQGAGAGWSCEPLAPEDDNCDDVLLRVNGIHPTPEGVVQLIGGRGVVISGSASENEIVVRTVRMPGEIQCEMNN